MIEADRLRRPADSPEFFLGGFVPRPGCSGDGFGLVRATRFSQKLEWAVHFFAPVW